MKKVYRKHGTNFEGITKEVKTMKKLMGLLLVAVLLAGVGGVCLANAAQTSSEEAPSAPPIPGINKDFTEKQMVITGVSPTINPGGFVTVFPGTQFRITISGIDMFNWTRVVLFEWIPYVGWTAYDLSGWHYTGQASVRCYAGRRGLHYFTAWVDNNHNGWYDPGELTPYLRVLVI
jgi:hypothetical protein